MPDYRSRTITHGRNMAGARALLRAAGVASEDIGRKPIVAVANSFCEFVPGHTHLAPVGRLMCQAIEQNGGIAREFNTIALDDGIAMGHGGMLYSLPSRDLIADSVEYVVEAHRADALVCLSNCDKITPGLLMAALRLNIPTVFVSGGPMEGGRAQLVDGRVKTRLNLVSVMAGTVDSTVSDDDLARIEAQACPTCGSCSGMFTANSMNCLLEALGLALPGNGTTLATHTARSTLLADAAAHLMRLIEAFYVDDDPRALPRSIASAQAFDNAMALDLAMGGSTNTVLHLLAAAHEAGVPFDQQRVDELSRQVPVLCKIAPNGDHLVEDVHRAGGVPAILGHLARADLLHRDVHAVHSPSLDAWLSAWDLHSPEVSEAAVELFHAAPGCRPSSTAFSQSARWESLDLDVETGCIRSPLHAHQADGGLAVLSGNLAPDGCVIKTAGLPTGISSFTGPAVVVDSQEEACEAILTGRVSPGDVLVVRFEGPRGGPGMQEMLYPTAYLQGRGLHATCALVTDGRFSGGSSGIAVGHVSPEAAAGGPLALVRDGDAVTIDVPRRRLHLDVSDTALAERRAEAGPGGPRARRERRVPHSLRAYAHMVSSADRGAIRVVPD